MEKLVKFLVLLIVFEVVIITSFGSFTYMHEAAHVRINKYINGVDSVVTFGPLMAGGSTVPVLTTPEERASYNRNMHYHAMNEMIGYNTMGVVIAILLTGGFIAFAVVLGRQGKQ